MKNKLQDLNNHLFAQLERLGEEDLTTDKLREEVARSKAITGISKNIIDNARIVLHAAQLVNNNDIPEVPSMLGIEMDKK